VIRKILLMVISGILFGSWPLLFQRSGMKSNAFTALAVIITFFCTIPFCFREAGISKPESWNTTILAMGGMLIVIGIILFFFKDFETFAGVDWYSVYGALATGTISILIFNNTILTVTKEEARYLLIVMIMVQISVPAMLSIFQDGGINIKKGFGFVFAVLAVLSFA